MKLHWLAVAACLGVLANGHPLSDSTQDTLVVARSEDATTEPAVKETTEQTEVSSDGPTPPIKLLEMDVSSTVSLRYAHTLVMARVKNPAKRAQEANFRVLLPETAFVSGFVMTLDGKSYKAYVKEKEEAKQIYDQAVSQGLGAAHVQAKARDSNQFVVSVNVEPSSTAVFNLTYEELLIRRDGVYHHSLNLHPGAPVPKLSVTVHIKEAQKITELRVPEIRTGNEIDATKDDAQNTKAVIKRSHDDREVTISFAPDLEEQKRLMDIYAEKSRESASNTNRYTGQEDTENKAEGVLGQFVVQYDVERPKDGEILVNEGYFVHFFAPSELPPLQKYVVFVLDTSGSMMDRKIVQLREAMQTILSDLNPGDFFSIVEFSSYVTIHSLKEADQEPPKRNYYYNDFENKPPTLIPPSPATPENIAKAKVIVSRLDASGGTNIDSALDVAVNLIHKRTEWGKKPTPAANVTAEGSTTQAPTTQATTELAKEDAEAVADFERMKMLEPIIIFLTDGDPTVGEINPTTIINRLTEKNYGPEKATMFCLAFGDDADHKFLRKMALRSDGFMRHIYEAADAALQLQDFYRRVSSPLLADVHFIYPDTQVKEGTVTKNKFKTYYAGSEVVVAGQVAEEASEVSAQVLAFCGVEDGVGRKRFEKTPKAPVPAKRQEYLPLERLWSYLTIKQLLDKKDASDEDDDSMDNPKKKALALALKYEFVTPLTSLVVVKPNATSAVNAESVDKPNNNNQYAYLQPLSLNTASLSASYPSPGVPLSGAGLYRPQFGFSSQVQLQEALLDSVDVAEDYEFDLQDKDAQSFYSSHSYVPYPANLNIMRHRIALPSPILFRTQSLDHDSYSAGHAASPGIFGPPPSLQASYRPSYPLTTPVLVIPSPVPTPAPSRLLYHLNEYVWTEDLIVTGSDELRITLHNDTIVYKLARGEQALPPSSSESSCAAAVDGGDGRCVYLTRCVAAKNISLMTYVAKHCSVDGFAGVCCSEKDIVKTDAPPSN